MEAAPPPSTAVDLEIGEAEEAAPSTTAAAAAVDLEIEGPMWLHRLEQPKTRRTNAWSKVAFLTGIVSLPFYSGLILKYGPNFHPLLPALVEMLITVAYISFIFFVTLAREPLPYVLRRSEKLSIESAFVGACSCWTLFEMDGDIFTAILGLILLFKLIPFMNLWWDFENFDSLDCYSAMFIDAAFVCCRYVGGGVGLIFVTGVGVALHFVKDAYRHYSYQKIKIENQNHLI